MREDFNYYQQNVNKAEEAGKKFLKKVDNKTCFVKKKNYYLNFARQQQVPNNSFLIGIFKNLQKI